MATLHGFFKPAKTVKSSTSLKHEKEGKKGTDEVLNEHIDAVTKRDIHHSWAPILGPEFLAPYFQELEKAVAAQRQSKTVYPPENQVFSAFASPLERVRVVILGQDPYHGPGQAHGLAFSVPHGVKPPPSLRNIIQEVSANYDTVAPSHGNLLRWAKQGVLLLNTLLTVVKGQPMAHKNLGWERFTEAVVKHISKHRSHVVFMLWGNPAQAKAKFIDSNKHLVLKARHPSPLSAHSGFFGCKHFKLANEYLESMGEEPIDWALDGPLSIKETKEAQTTVGSALVGAVAELEHEEEEEAKEEKLEEEKERAQEHLDKFVHKADTVGEKRSPQEDGEPRKRRAVGEPKK